MRLRYIALGMVVLLGLGLCGMLIISHDPAYRMKDWLSLGRYQRFDALIQEASAKQGLDPALVKAIVWRESRFQPDKQGAKGERGLMQITEIAARDWAKTEQIQSFQPTDLFSPRTNLEIGTWYLARAIRRWQEKDDPLPFALAEYNAGRSRVNRWDDVSGKGPAHEMRNAIDFPGTRSYVDSILRRREAYRKP